MGRNPTSLPDLTAWRKKSGTSLAEISQSTKIAMRYLVAIERGRFDILPGGTYSVSYLRQYARAIRYDGDALVAYYLKVSKPDEILRLPPPTPPTRMRRWARSLRALAWPGLPYFRG